MNMENVINQRKMKLITSKTRRNYLVSEFNHHTIFFLDYLLAKEQKIKKSTHEYNRLLFFFLGNFLELVQNNFILIY